MYHLPRPTYQNTKKFTCIVYKDVTCIVYRDDLHWRQQRAVTDILYRVYENRVEDLYHI